MTLSDLGFMSKALLAGLTAGVGSLATGAIDGSLDLAEYLTAAASALVALGGVYGIPNQPREAERAARHARQPD